VKVALHAQFLPSFLFHAEPVGLKMIDVFTWLHLPMWRGQGQGLGQGSRHSSPWPVTQSMIFISIP